MVLGAIVASLVYRLLRQPPCAFSPSGSILLGRHPQPSWQRKSCRTAVVHETPVAPTLAPGSSTSLDEPGALLRSAAWDSFGKQVGLSVASPSAQRSSRHSEGVPPPRAEQMRQQMQRDGYSTLPRLTWDPDDKDMESLSSFDRAIDLLEAAGLPPQFLLVFDEVWDVVDRVARTLEPVYGLQNIFDFYVFDVKPGKGGWSLHRDRPSGAVGFQADGLPDYTTVWLAITDASPATSCIYVLPASNDPEYKSMSGSKHDRGVVAHFLQHLRALPVERGTVLHWSHRVLHWGSASPAEAPSARKTLTFAMARPSYEQPLLSLEPGASPCFEARLVLVAYTLICYHHSQPVPTALRSALVEVIRQHSGHLAVGAIVQSTGESFFKNLLLLSEGGDSELAASCESTGELVLKQFNLDTTWWRQEWYVRRSKAQIF